jgi:hypothetical protein
MTLAIMQPYLFPYVGYFQLIQAVDKFVFYDDVNFIKQGWINRNRILQANEAVYFTLPVKSISSFTKICDTQIDEKSFPLWRNKFLKTLQYNYTKAPYFTQAFSIIENVLTADTLLINNLAKESIIAIADYIGIETTFNPSSSMYNNQHLSSQARVIDICIKENASTYINMPGGAALYNETDFANEKIKLNFIKSKIPAYKQFNDTFQPGLSIIDVMMFCSKEQIKEMMNEFFLLNKNEV